MSERRFKPPKDDLPRPWDEHPVSRERWLRHREVMMQWAHAGHRPQEWWVYEKQMPRPEQETNALYEMGELSEAELAELMPDWREHYEQAQKPNFSHCIGHKSHGDTFASWIKGPAARKAHYRWAEIPDAIVRQWNAERRPRKNPVSVADLLLKSLLQERGKR